MICALALGTALTIRAEDTPAQAAARAALASKLFEMGADVPATNAPATPMPPKVDTVAPAPPVMSEMPPAAKPMDEPAMVPVNGDAKAKAKAAKAAKAAEMKAQQEADKKAAAQKEYDAEMAKAKADADKAAAKAKAKADAEQAAADMKAQKAAAKKAADQKAAEIAAAKKQVKTNMEQPKMEQPMTVDAPRVTPGNTDTPEQAKAREALAHSLFEESAATPTTPMAPAIQPSPVPMLAPAPAPKVQEPSKVMQPSLPVMPMAPALPISEDKQQKLQELLGKYKADQITPEEYQKQRAAILAGQ